MGYLNAKTSRSLFCIIYKERVKGEEKSKIAIKTTSLQVCAITFEALTAWSVKTSAHIQLLIKKANKMSGFIRNETGMNVEKDTTPWSKATAQLRLKC